MKKNPFLNTDNFTIVREFNKLQKYKRSFSHN